jgi:hypothetical protein
MVVFDIQQQQKTDDEDRLTASDDGSQGESDTATVISSSASSDNTDEDESPKISCLRKEKSATVKNVRFADECGHGLAQIRVMVSERKKKGLIIICILHVF